MLASPHILTADNREASIHIGTEIPILTSQSNVPGIAGQLGQTALGLLQSQLQRTMPLVGVTSVAELREHGRDLVRKA